LKGLGNLAPNALAPVPTAPLIDSIEFEKKLEMAAYSDGFSVDGKDEGGWIPTTKKKGPSRRLPKKKRRSIAKIKKL